MKFSKLKEYIKNGEYQKIDEWFEENKVSENLKLENQLMQKIWSERKLFPSFSNKKQYDIEKTKREIAILKNLSFESQIKFLFSLRNVNSDHLNVIKTTTENEKFFKSEIDFIDLITEKFITEDFEEIEKIQKKFSFNIMDQKIYTAIFYYDIKYAGSRLRVYKDFLPINQPIFCPKCGIIFNYSKDKRKFLEERNIALPTIEETNILYHEMKKALHNNEFFTLLLSTKLGSNIEKKLDQLFKNYEILKLNLDLENKLQIKDNFKKKIKI